MATILLVMERIRRKMRLHEFERIAEPSQWHAI